MPDETSQKLNTAKANMTRLTLWVITYMVKQTLVKVINLFLQPTHIIFGRNFPKNEQNGYKDCEKNLNTANQYLYPYRTHLKPPKRCYLFI
jgi:hypothetical protein